MRTVINKYLAYDKSASEIADIAYKFGARQASKAIKAEINSYEVLAIIIDNIMRAFALQRIQYSTILRKEERMDGKTKS